MPYKILAEAVGANSSASADTAENKGGIVIYVVKNTDVYNKQEVGRVAFERKNSLNPRASFETQLDKEVGKAKKAVETLNELFADAGRLA